jgi:hypothetical protein
MSFLRSRQLLGAELAAPVNAASRCGASAARAGSPHTAAAS